MRKSIDELKDDLTLAENHLVTAMQELIDRGVYSVTSAREQIELLKEDIK